MRDPNRRWHRRRGRSRAHREDRPRYHREEGPRPRRTLRVLVSHRPQWQLRQRQLRQRQLRKWQLRQRHPLQRGRGGSQRRCRAGGQQRARVASISHRPLHHSVTVLALHPSLGQCWLQCWLHTWLHQSRAKPRYEHLRRRGEIPRVRRGRGRGGMTHDT